MSTSTVLNIALWLFTISGFVVYNLYQKNIKLENIVEEQNNTLISIKAVIEESNRVLTELDRQGIYRSDDEVGTFFKTLKNIQSLLDEFFKK